jgi:2-C-methyl-D-erythritol 4-phosphate cytidylyltransferase
MANVVNPDDWVLVHDAARPCLARADVERLIEAVGEDENGGILAVPLADTLKRADEAQRIAATEPRERLWLAQTPQMFRHGTLLRALGSVSAATDDASAVEALGLKPKLVPGSLRNLKVTYPADLSISDLMIQSI